MYVCICRAVAKATVERVIREGASTLDDVAARCGAGGGCGICRPALAELIDDCDQRCADCPRSREPVYSLALAGGRP